MIQKFIFIQWSWKIKKDSMLDNFLFPSLRRITCQDVSQNRLQENFASSTIDKGEKTSSKGARNIEPSGINIRNPLFGND